MTAAGRRAILSHALIVGSLTIGGWLMLVEPRARELVRVESEIRLNEKATAGPTDLTVERIAGQFAQLRARVSEIATRNAAARDSALLYRTIKQLAEHHGVHVQTLSPGSPGATSASTKAGASTTAMCELTMDGPYEALSRMLDAVLDGAGHVRLALMEIAPSKSVAEHELDSVSARLTFETISFTIPDVLVQVQGDADGAK